MTPKEKYRKLVDVLYEKTANRELNWQYNVGLDTHVFIGGRLVILTEEKNEDREPVEIITIRDSNAKIVESFTDESLSDKAPPIAGLDNYWQMMTRLREMAYRQAIGADVAIDAILSELDKDDL